MRIFPNEYIETNSHECRVSRCTNKFINKVNVVFIFPLHIRTCRNISTVSCVFSYETSGEYLYNMIYDILQKQVYLIVEDGYLIKNEDTVDILHKNSDGNVYITIYEERDLH